MVKGTFCFSVEKQMREGLDEIMNSICCSKTADFLNRLEDRLSLAEPSVRAEYAAVLKSGVALAVRRAVLEMAGRHADELALDVDEREELNCLLRPQRLRLYLSTSYRTEQAPDAETLERYARDANTAAGILTSRGYSVFSPVSVRYAVASPFFDSPPEPLDFSIWCQNCLPLLKSWAGRLLLLTTPEWLEDQEIRQEIFEARAAGIPVQVLSADTLCSAGNQVSSIMEAAPLFHLCEDGQDMSVEFILHVYEEHLGVPLPHMGALVDCLGRKATLDLLEEWGNEAARKGFLARFPSTFPNRPEQGGKHDGGLS